MARRAGSSRVSEATAGTILVFNAGSSSLKFGLFDARDVRSLAERDVSLQPGAPWPDLGHMVTGVIESIASEVVVAVGHRVVHGGARFTQPVLIDAVVRKEIAELVAIAPLHNGPALAAIDAAIAALPGVPQVAVFDTAFHATLPEEAYLYAVPYAWYQDHGVRRYGFHGTSHHYCALRAAELLDLPIGALKLVTCHLGSGCSLAAIDGGRSLATTMGFTPLDGLVMATRPGVVDPGILTWMLSTGRIGLDELDTVLHHQSGLLGLSGFTGDMREIVSRRAKGDRRAASAFDVYVFRLVQEIAAMAAALGGLDALVFTAGVGEHSPLVRAAACERLRWLGLDLDSERNDRIEPDGSISSPSSRVAVLVIRTREELLIARQCRSMLASRE